MKESGVIQFGYPPVRIDIINTVDGVDFTECFQNKNEIEIDGLTVNFISLEDLLKNKRATARPRDIDYIENLRE